MPRLLRFAATRVVLLLTLPIAAACGGNNAVDEQADYRVAVDVALVQLGELRDVATASGTIVPARAADLTVYAPETAEIVELPVETGAAVEVGDLLVRLDIASITQERAAAQLQLIEASSRADRTETELARQTSLFERGITSRNAYDEARVSHAAAESVLAAARARIEALEASDDRSLIRAPFAGTIMAVWHNVGDFVRPDTTDPILRVIDPSRVQASVQLPFAQLARTAPGQTATVQTLAGGTEPATVASVAAGLAPGAPTGEVRLNFDNPVELPLDTPLSVELVLDRRSSVTIVPSQAVGQDDLGTYVLIAGDDGVARRRDVRLGLTTRQFSQVAEGVEIGEQVVLLTEYDEIVDGTPIVIAR